MKNRFKIILSRKKFYREIELPEDLHKLVIGTALNCDVRLRKGLFFEGFELSLFCENDEWKIVCSDNVYMTGGNVQKLIIKKLEHGDELCLRYQKTDSEVFRLSFMIDFESGKRDYSRRIELPQGQEILIGGDARCQVRVESSYIGNDSISIVKDNRNRWILKEKSSAYGIYVNGRRRSGEIRLNGNDFISLADASFYLKGNSLYVSRNLRISAKDLKIYDVSESRTVQDYPHFNRSTRMRAVIPEDAIPVLDPPDAPEKPGGNLILQLLPAVIMLGVTILFRVVLSSSGSSYIWISLISMTLGICTSVAGIVSERKKYKKDTEERRAVYTAYVEKKKAEIEESRKLEKELLEDCYYAPSKEIQIINDFSSDLFNRDRMDKDFLEIYLGTGKRPALRKIEYKRQEKFGGTDDLTEIPENLAREYRDLNGAPITVDLKQTNAVGFVGLRMFLYGMLKNITIDLSTRQYFQDVRLFYILDAEYQKEFEWLRCLPHVQNEDLAQRNIVCDSDSKNILFEYLYKELNRRSTEGEEFQTILTVFVYNDQGLKRHPISRFIDRAAELGVCFLFFEEYADFLPNNCDTVIELRDGQNGKVVQARDALKECEFYYNEIEDKTVRRLAQKLAPVYCDEVSLEGTLTKNITLFELLNILSTEDIDLEKNWRSSQVYNSMGAPLGVRAKNQIVSLDLNEKHHGPHGLVAGTTGSGKSEILQSYILSMAVLFHPYEVGFVIIDFKGGGMVNQFKDLPHLVGAITNIDGREINRSLLSIKAELRKRQELFAEYGVNHIDSYIRLYKKGEAGIPLPHLILIVDEFAELKMDQPEFMKELISAARIGRSLGIHLILATQKPSGVVDAQIWSNSKFRLCLKVQNKEDSNEVLKTPLAAEIMEPGRAYLQVGNNEIFELFQSAYSGAPASADDGTSGRPFRICRLDLSGKRTVIYEKKIEKREERQDTQLEAIVRHVSAFCEEQKIQRLPGICLPPLGEVYSYGNVKPVHGEGGICIPVGIFDDPDHQRQDQIILNISENNTFILGSSQFGKTCMLQTFIRGLAQAYTPKEVNIYIIDYASMALKVFDELKHVGGVMLPGEDEKLKLFFRMISKEMKRRKEKFSQMGITSYQSYREAGFEDLPQIVILLDNMTAFRELCGEYDDDLLNLVREGSAIGISVNVTSQQISGIGYKYLAAFSNKYGLTCNDKSEYSSLFDRCRMEPRAVPGRGLASVDKVLYEFQTYLGFEGKKEIQRVEAIRTFIQERNAACTGVGAKRIPEVPAVLKQEYLESAFGPAAKDSWYMGIDFDTVEPVLLNSLKDGYLVISGKENSGRSNYVRYLFRCMERRIFDEPVEAYVIDGFDQKLGILKDYGFVEQYTTDASEFEMIVDRIESACEDRADRCQTEGTEFLDEEPLLLVVVNHSAVYDASKTTKEVCAQWKNIMKSYKNMKVLFILSGIENAAIGYGANDLMKQIKEGKNILFFDDLAGIKLTDVPAGIQRQFKKSVEAGDAYYITTGGVRKLRTPLYEED